MKAAADNSASVTLELGGKSPAVVDSSANLYDASRRMAWGKCLNNVTCIAPDYLLVQASIADAFLEELRARFADMYGHDSDGQLSSHQRSKMVNDHHFNRVVGLIEDAVNKGARGAWRNVGRQRAPHRPHHVGQRHPRHGGDARGNFGPVLPVLRWTNEEDVNNVVAVNPHPLAMYFFSKTMGPRWRAGCKPIPAGTTAINEVVLQVAQPPAVWQGSKPAAWDAPVEFAGFKAFSNLRSVVAQRSTRFNVLPLTFPRYLVQRHKLIAAVQRWL